MANTNPRSHSSLVNYVICELFSLLGVCDIEHFPICLSVFSSALMRNAKKSNSILLPGLIMVIKPVLGVFFFLPVIENQGEGLQENRKDNKSSQPHVFEQKSILTLLD